MYQQLFALALDQARRNQEETGSSGVKAGLDGFFRTSRNTNGTGQMIAGNIFDPMNFTGMFGGKKQKAKSMEELYGPPPQRGYDQAEYNRYKAGYNDLTSTFERRSKGEDIFDYIKFLFEPQKTALLQDYGLTNDPNDVYHNQSGSLAKTNANLNSRGLLDTGTSGVVEGQLRSNANNKLAELFGNAKQLQKTEIDNALDALHTLYPENFQIADIPYAISYGNELNNYNAKQGALAQQYGNIAATPSNSLFGKLSPLLGKVAGSALNYFGGSGSGVSSGGSGISNILGSLLNSSGSNSQTRSSGVNTNTPGLGYNYSSGLNSSQIFGATQPKSAYGYSASYN